MGATMNYQITRNETENARLALIAEDDDATLTTIARYLRADGYRVLEASSSIEALLLAMEFPDRIDVLFTSLDLRKYCNGVELAGCLRVSRPEIEVVYLSGEGDGNEEADREILDGDALSLEKPLISRDLAALLSKIACRTFKDTCMETFDCA